MNEEKTRTEKHEYISEYEKRLLEIMQNSDYIPPEIGLAYVSLQIAKNPQIVAYNSGNSKIPNFKPNTTIEKHESLELALIEATQQLKELKIPLGSNGSIINGISTTDYYETFNRIMREHKIVRHPRTSEYILTATDDIRLPPIRKEHLNYCPRLPYNQVVNRRQISGKFIITKKPENAKPYETQQLEIKLIGKLKYQNTKTFKINYNGIRKPSKKPSQKGLWIAILSEKDKAKMSLLNGWKLQQQKHRKPKRKLISQITITNITTN